MGIDKGQDIFPPLSPQFSQAEKLGDFVDRQHIGIMADRFHLDIRGDHPFLDPSFNLFADVTDDSLDHPAFDASIFDQSQVNMGTLLDLADEAHSAYDMHYISSLSRKKTLFPFEKPPFLCSV
jgi:hypothetical protein